MKIGFCGAGGTGKTTVAKELARVLDIPFMPSPSRMCFAKHGVKTEDDQAKMTPEQRWALQYDIFLAIDKQVSENDHGIFDRTHLDNLGYGLLQCRDTIKPEEWESMDALCIRGLKTFDQLFYAPIYDWRNVVDDGMRTNNLAARHLHSNFVRGYLVLNRIDHIILRNEPIDLRIKLIKEWLS